MKGFLFDEYFMGYYNLILKIILMREIHDITSLEGLAKYDEMIRNTCKISINPTDYDDIVNDMYIKLHKYISKGVHINGGYIFMIMKTINLNNIAASKTSVELDEIKLPDEEIEEIIDERMKKLDDFLGEFLTKDEIDLYKFYKLNSLNSTSEKYGIPIPQMRYKLKLITKKIKEETHGQGLTKDIFNK